VKKTYSVILLISFLTGAIQPVVPLLEYHFFKESIIELFCVNRDVPDSDCQGFCYLTNQIEESQENQPDTRAAHSEYYPGTVLPDHKTDMKLFPKNDDPFIQVPVYGLMLSLNTEIPPPKMN
jgi:hypothetical protein